MRIDFQSPGFYSYDCDKPECTYCVMINNKKEIHQHIRVIRKQYTYSWQKHELDILYKNIMGSIEYLQNILTLRTRGAIIQKRSVMARSLGYKSKAGRYIK